MEHIFAKMVMGFLFFVFLQLLHDKWKKQRTVNQASNAVDYIVFKIAYFNNISNYKVSSEFIQFDAQLNQSHRRLTTCRNHRTDFSGGLQETTLCIYSFSSLGTRDDTAPAFLNMHVRERFISLYMRQTAECYCKVIVT